MTPRHKWAGSKNIVGQADVFLSLLHYLHYIKSMTSYLTLLHAVYQPGYLFPHSITLFNLFKHDIKGKPVFSLFLIEV